MSGSSSADAGQSANDTLAGVLDAVGNVDTSGTTWTAPGGVTTGAWDASLAAANSPTWNDANNQATGYIDTLNSQGGLTSGQQSNLNTTNGLTDQYGSLGSNNGLNTNQQALYDQYGNLASSAASGTDTAALTQQAIDDALQATNKSFNSSGLFGSDSNQEAAAKGATEAANQITSDNYWKGIDAQNAAPCRMKILCDPCAVFHNFPHRMHMTNRRRT